MLRLPATKVYLAPGVTDMRAGIDRLSMTVQGLLALDPFSGHLFVFCNRKRDALKVLYWDRNGITVFGTSALRSIASAGRSTRPRS